MSYRGPSDQYNSESSEDSDSSSHPLNHSRVSNFFQKNSAHIKFNMAQPNVNTAANAVPISIPVLKQEYLHMIPDFDGRSELLPRFIEISEKLVNKFYNTVDPTDFQNEYLMSSILAKIKGEAAINISSCIINNWNDLKLSLLNAYADKRDIYTLNIEMTECKQENESPFEFYTRIQQILNLQTSYIATHSEGNEAVVLINYHRNLALRILLRGLKDPVGSLMRTKNPPDLNSALNMLTNDFQIETAQNRIAKIKSFNNKPINSPIQNKPIFQNRLFRPNSQPQLQLRNFQHNPQLTQKLMRPDQGVGPSTNRNVFRPNQLKNLPKPVPMSVSTTNTYRPGQNPQGQNRIFRPNNQNYFRSDPNARPNFIAEELFNIDDQPSVELPDDDHYDETTENPQNEFFQEVASESEYMEPNNHEPQNLN